MLWRARPLLLVAAATIAPASPIGCSDDGFICPASYLIPFVFHAVDSESGQVVCLDGYSITSPDGSKEQPHGRGPVFGDCSYFPYLDEEGAYTVEVEAEGYLTPEAQVVQVTRTGRPGCYSYRGDRDLIFTLLRGPDWEPSDLDGGSDAGTADSGTRQAGTDDADPQAPELP